MLSYLVEIRSRLIKILIVFLCLFVLFFSISNELFYGLTRPLLQFLPNQTGVIATNITSLLFTPIHLASDAALLFLSPFILFHIWCFITPGLYHSERKVLFFVIVFSAFLFILGGLVCYYLVLPYMFQLVIRSVPEYVNLMPDMNYSIDLITRMLMTFGFCFQVPLLLLVLVYFNFVSVGNLKKIRPYVIVIAFVLGMLLTPPDVFSQVMLAVPLWLLYELGILLINFNFKCYRNS